jgi:Apea-like HEPN
MANLTGTTIGKLLFGDVKEDVLEFSIPSDIQLFKRNLREKIEIATNELNCSRTYLFGAWVIQGDAVSSIELGPVHFLLRERWIQEAVKAGLITEAQSARILKRWREKPAKAHNKKYTKSRSRENDIIDTIGPCPWACKITVVGHSDERSQEKAIIAARIALAAISLSWDRQTSTSRETGLLFDLGPYRTRTIVAYAGDQIVKSLRQSVLRLGWFLHATDGPAFTASSGKRLETVGRALNTFIAVEPHGKNQKLEAILCRALMWFGEACREPLDFLSIVKFAATLDTLAKGTHADGISDLIKKRFPIKDLDAPFLTDGTSAKHLVEQIYDTGRSRIVHGSRPSLVEDFDQLRARAEMLARFTLRACIH